MRGRLIVHGGSEAPDETWEWDRRTWQRVNAGGPGIRGKRLLAHHVLAVLERINGDLGMQRIGHADVDYVDLIRACELPPVAAHSRPAPRPATVNYPSTF